MSIAIINLDISVKLRPTDVCILEKDPILALNVNITSQIGLTTTSI